MSKPTVLSFFSGAMGLDLGIEKAGFEITSVCENNKYCRRTILDNRPGASLSSDINNYSTSVGGVDLIVGGPPCQSFSTAGKRKGVGDLRGDLLLKYVELSLLIRPKYIVIENVRGLLSIDKGAVMADILQTINKSGYGVSFNLYNSANFGVPQIRDRVIIICSRNGITPPYLTPTHSNDPSHGLPPWRTFRNATSDLVIHDYVDFPNKRLKYYRMLTEGQNWKNLPVDAQKEAMGRSYYSRGGKTGFLRRLHWDKPSPTLLTSPIMPATSLCHPTENRPLSIQEYKRVQEFPDDWILSGSLLHQYKQVGNAVPIGLGYAVGTLVMRLLNGNKLVQYPDFKYSRYNVKGLQPPDVIVNNRDINAE